MARRTPWTNSRVPDLAGRLVVITGGDRGLGFEAAKVLAAAGADLVIASHEPERGAAATEAISRIEPRAQVRCEPIDLADLASVEAFAAGRRLDGRPIDVLINNAGIMFVPERMESVDGFELQLATNFLGHYALTGHLLDLVRAAPAPRVIWASSVATRWGRIRLHDLHRARRYHPAFAYCQSKLACLMAAVELDRRSRDGDWGVSSIAAHPGFARTDLQRTGPRLGRGDGFTWSGAAGHLPRFSHTASEGAQGLIRAAADPDVEGGTYLGPTRSFGAIGSPERVPILRKARDRRTIDALWAQAAIATGVTWPGARDRTAA
ncbi:MAG: SDR family NAD(P)-dependent oxidoreductase [Pseudomonas sp.]|nr:SDR family NAD(P)-dependent oxidoreductase [Pseudomonas sp.]